MIFVIQDHDELQVIRAEARDNRVHIYESHNVDLDHLSEKLSSMKKDQVYIIGKFPSLANDLLVVPAAEKGLFRKIIAAEIKKRFSDLREPVHIQNKVGEIIRGGRKYDQFFVCGFDRRDADGLISQVTAADRECVFLSIAPLIGARLIGDYVAEDTVFVACDLEREKVFLLLLDKKVTLIRTVPSESPGFNGEDIDSAIQTLSFCRETLRVFPKKFYYLTPTDQVLEPSISGLETSKLILPLDGAYPELGLCALIVISSLLRYQRELSWANLLPMDYRALKKQAVIAKYMIVFLVAFSLYGLYSIAIQAYRYSIIKDEVMKKEKKVISMKPALDNYNAVKAELDKIMPRIEFHNNMLSMPEFWTRAKGVVESFTDVCKIDEMEIKRDEKDLLVHISGKIIAQEYSSAFNLYNSVISKISSNENNKIELSDINLMTKQFQLKIRIQ